MSRRFPDPIDPLLPAAPVVTFPWTATAWLVGFITVVVLGLPLVAGGQYRPEAASPLAWLTRIGFTVAVILVPMPAESNAHAATASR